MVEPSQAMSAVIPAPARKLRREGAMNLVCINVSS
jgi:hypothetical protein